MKQKNERQLKEYLEFAKMKTGRFLEHAKSVLGKFGKMTEDGGMAIQRLVFNSQKFNTAESARVWAQDHDFERDAVVKDFDSFQIEQADKSRFHEASFRTIKLTDGVSAVIGKMREAMTDDCCPWFVQNMPDDARALWIDGFNASWEKNSELTDEARAIQAMKDGDDLVRAAGWVYVGGSWMSEEAEAAVYEKDLPDSAFAVIEDGGQKDAEGKTEPRTLRHFAYKTKEGAIDAVRLKKAMGVIESSKLAEDMKKKGRAVLCAAAKEAGISESNRAPRNAQSFDYQINLAEAEYNKEAGTLLAVLIEAGTNPHKRRHYPKKTVESAAPDFAGLKMYVNHPTAHDEQVRPERDLRDWVSTIKESYAENGKAMGVIAVHDKWLKELLSDPTARKSVGLSINCRGQCSMGEIDGQQMQIVDKLIVEKDGRHSSVDWVTEPGARGRVVEVFESRRGDLDMLETITEKDLREQRPELVASIEEAAAAKIKKEGIVVNEVEKAGIIAEAQEAGRKAAVTVLEGAGKKADQKETLKGMIREAAGKPEALLPEVSREKVLESLCQRDFKDEAAMKEAVGVAVLSEAAYLKRVRGVNVNGGGSGHGATPEVAPLTEALGTRLEEQYGVAGIKTEPEKV